MAKDLQQFLTAIENEFPDGLLRVESVVNPQEYEITALMTLRALRGRSLHLLIVVSPLTRLKRMGCLDTSASGTLPDGRVSAYHLHLGTRKEMTHRISVFSVRSVVGDFIRTFARLPIHQLD